MRVPMCLVCVLLLAGGLLVHEPAVLAAAGGEGLLISRQLTGGTTTSVQQQADLGLVNVFSGFGNTASGRCSGALLANDWVITAGHCVDVIEGKNHWIGMAFTSGTWQADAVYKFGGGSLDPAGPDLALLHLAGPIVVNGNAAGFARRLWNDTLLDKTLAVFGASTGIYLGADMRVKSEDGRNIFVSNASGVTTASGDSGGPSFLWQDGVPYLAAVTTTTGGKLVSIPKHRAWIVAVTKSRWCPNCSTTGFWIDRDEVNATQWTFEPFGTDLTRVPWAMAQRAATTLCMNRAMSGGHFDGFSNGTLLHLQCSARTGVFFQDAPLANIPQPLRFADINAVHWAHAARAAERLCALASPAHVGGQFSGHQHDGRAGLFCFAQNAQWIDSTNATRAAAQVFIDDLNTRLWTDAARGATTFCQAQGAHAGFFNGHQADDGPQQPRSRKGVVCQR